MKRGDLVKMKYVARWTARREFESGVAIVLEQHHNAVKVILSDGRVKHTLSEYWEVISESGGDT